MFSTEIIHECRVRIKLVIYAESEMRLATTFFVLVNTHTPYGRSLRHHSDHEQKNPY